MMCEHAVGPCSSVSLSVLLLVLFVVMATVGSVPHANSGESEQSASIQNNHMNEEGLNIVRLVDSDREARSEERNGNILPNDERCLALGGMCVVKETCPQGKRRNETGLCSNSQQRGVCCHSVPEGSSCATRGGICRSPEDCSIPNAETIDCEDGNICCILVF